MMVKNDYHFPIRRRQRWNGYDCFWIDVSVKYCGFNINTFKLSDLP